MRESVPEIDRFPSTMAPLAASAPVSAEIPSALADYSQLVHATRVHAVTAYA
jgi:hypothetical protein